MVSYQDRPSDGSLREAATAQQEVYSPGFVGGFGHTPRFDYSYDGPVRSVEQSLLRTSLSSIDILLHDCDVWTHGGEAGRRFT